MAMAPDQTVELSHDETVNDATRAVEFSHLLHEGIIGLTMARNRQPARAVEIDAAILLLRELYTEQNHRARVRLEQLHANAISAARN